MILIAMTCVATLLLLVFGALWRQTLVLSRSSGPHYSQRGSMTSVPFRMHRRVARQSIAFFSLFEDREARDARITGRGFAYGVSVAEGPLPMKLRGRAMSTVDEYHKYPRD